MDQSRKKEILDLAEAVNSTSEEYQLVHAMFAIEMLFKDKQESIYTSKLNDVRNALRDPQLSSSDRDHLMQKAKLSIEEAKRKARIVVQYIPHMKEGNGRITKTANNAFIIVLPESMQNTRGSDGKIDFERLRKLRELMAHELGHVALHSGVLSPCTEEINDGSEEEALLFAETLIELRRKRNAEIYANQHFQTI